MKKGIIYKATNLITGESYIGQTTIKLKYRIWQHYHKNKQRRSYHFQRVLEMFQKEDFKWEILESEIPKENLNEREKYWIEFYDTYNNGYNCNKGGETAKVSREYHLWHPEKVEIQGDFQFVMISTGIHDSTLINLFNGVAETSKGYCLYKNKDIYHTFKMIRGKKEPKQYERKGYKCAYYEAKNTLTGETIIDTSPNLSERFNVSSERIRQVALGRSKWILKIKEWRFKLRSLEKVKKGQKK